jgi:hypothetical protein
VGRWRLAGLVPPGFRADLAAAGWAVVAGTVRRAVQQRHSGHLPSDGSQGSTQSGAHYQAAAPVRVAWRAPPVGGEHHRHPEGPSSGWSAMAPTPAVAVGAGRPAAGGPGRRRLVQLPARRRRQAQPGRLRSPTHPPNPHQSSKPRAPSMPAGSAAVGRRRVAGVGRPACRGRRTQRPPAGMTANHRGGLDLRRATGNAGSNRPRSPLRGRTGSRRSRSTPRSACRPGQQTMGGRR